MRNEILTPFQIFTRFCELMNQVYTLPNIVNFMNLGAFVEEHASYFSGLLLTKIDPRQFEEAKAFVRKLEGKV